MKKIYESPVIGKFDVVDIIAVSELSGEQSGEPINIGFNELFN